jgi:hypothetical protein
VAAVFGFVEHFASFGKDACGKGDRAVDGPLLGKKIGFVPIFPRLEWLAVDLGGEADAIALFDVQTDDEDLRPSREIGPILPQGTVRRVVMLSDFYRFDDSVSPNRKSRVNRALFRTPLSYSHPAWTTTTGRAGEFWHRHTRSQHPFFACAAM